MDVSKCFDSPQIFSPLIYISLAAALPLCSQLYESLEMVFFKLQPV